MKDDKIKKCLIAGYDMNIINQKELNEYWNYITNLQEGYDNAINQSVIDHKYASQKEDEVIVLQERIDKAKDKIQYIIDYGFDYDGFNTVESLKGLIDMLVDYARQSKDILNGGDE